MTTIRSSYDAALLADAVYLDLSGATPGEPLTGPALVAALRPKGVDDPDNRLTRQQATYISANYDLIAFQSDLLSGFQGAVFQDRTTGEYVLSFRGSEEVADYIADFGIAFLRGAFFQVKEMYAFMQELYEDYSVPHNTKFDVVGHSLGGHLAQILASYHPERVGSVVTLNGAGVGTSGPRIVAAALIAGWRTQGGVPANVDVTNVIGEAGLEIVPSVLTGPKLGPEQEIFIEDQTTLVPFSALANHSLAPQVDALTVYRVFERLVGAASLDLDELARILRASADDPFESLENALNMLGRLLDVGNSATSASRESLHSVAAEAYDAIVAAQDDGAAFTLTSLTGMSVTYLAAQALRADDTGLAFRVVCRAISFAR